MLKASSQVQMWGIPSMLADQMFGRTDYGSLFRGDTNVDLLLDYSLYLYENELHRTTDLNATSKTYIVFISSTFTALLAGLTWVGTDYFVQQIERIGDPLHLMVFALFLSSIFVLVLAFIFVVLSVKIRSFERLCDPIDFLNKSEQQDMDLNKKDITANYIVATSRNYTVNNQKSRWLFRGLITYLLALILFLSFVMSNMVTFII